MGFGSNLPDSNEIPSLRYGLAACESDRFDALEDDVCLILNDRGKRCSVCKLVARNRNIVHGKDGENICKACLPLLPDIASTSQEKS